MVRLLLMAALLSGSLAQAADSASDNAQARCLAKIKAAMKSGAYAFQPAGDDAVMAAAHEFNALIPQLASATRTSTVRYSDSLFIKSLQINFSKAVDRFHYGYNVEVSRVQDDTKQVFEIDLEFSKKKSGVSSYKLTQYIDYGADCVPHITSTNEERWNIEKNKIKSINRTFYAGEAQAEVKRGEATIPADATLAPDLSETIDIKWLADLFKRQQSTYDPGPAEIPITLLRPIALKRIRAKDPFLNRTVNMALARMMVQIPGYSAPVHFMISPYSSYSVMDLVGTKSMMVPEKVWDQSDLGKDTASHGVATVEVNPEVYRAGGRFRSLTSYDRDFDFPNLVAYWHVDDKKQDGRSIVAHWTAQPMIADDEPSDPLVTDPVRLQKDENLLSTDLVQTDLLEIKEMASQLRASKPSFVKAFESTTRLEMAKSIAVIVNQYLTYDDQALNENTVHQLTTKSILGKHVGVCQHFANLFTALARASGVPAHIVTGYLVGEKELAAHAWVEIEVRDGVWRPVEPQDNVLEFNPSRYIPLSQHSNEYLNDHPGVFAQEASAFSLHLNMKILGFAQ